MDMLEQIDLEQTISKADYKKQAAQLRQELSVLAQQVRQAKLPVLLLFEGWGAAGKGNLISKLIAQFDPRGFRVYSNAAREPFEQRRPLLWRYWQQLPERGQIAVLDPSWYQDMSVGRIEED